MTNDQTRLDIRITRNIKATPEIVFAQWLDAEALKDWFAPKTYTGVSAKVDARVGGAWEVHYQSDSGHQFSEQGVFTEIIPHQRLALTLKQSGVADSGELKVVVTFQARNGGTEMHFHQEGFVNLEHRNGVAEGWRGCFDKLDARIEAVHRSESEIRTLFDDWFRASQRKDLDASMSPIADSIVSYEHSVPLEVRDIAVMREECARGFEQSGDDFRWDIPDLQVIIRGDIAVTWGLNRMANYADGQVASAMWSRGTRIFQHIEGRWQMIHQHVSFPIDPGTGQGRLDLIPDSN